MRGVKETAYYVIVGTRRGIRTQRRTITADGLPSKEKLMAEYERLKRLGYKVRAKLVTSTEEPIDWASDPET